MNTTLPIEDVLKMYEEGMMSDHDFVFSLFGLLDVHAPDEIFARVPPVMQQDFMVYLRQYVGSLKELLRYVMGDKS